MLVKWSQNMLRGFITHEDYNTNISKMFEIEYDRFETEIAKHTQNTHKATLWTKFAKDKEEEQMNQFIWTIKEWMNYHLVRISVQILYSLRTYIHVINWKYTNKKNVKLRA